MQPPSEEALLQATQDLMAIESTAENAAGLKTAYDYIVEMIRNSGKGITIEEFECNGKLSLLAYLDGQRPDTFHIILNGHVDVVPGKPEQYVPEVKDGKLYGRGAYDMKAATVILTAVFCEFVDKVPYPLGLQIVTDEENAGKDGTLHQVQQGVRADFVICGECGRASDSYEIANEAKGFVVADIGFQGVSAHSGYPWKADNAAIKASHFMHLLHERYPVPTEEDHGTVVVITAITADSGAHSRIPDYATVKVAARYVTGDPDFKSFSDFDALMKRIDPNATIVKVHDFTSPIYTDPENPLLLKLKASAERIEGHQFNFVQRHGTSDGRFYGDVGNEACEFGIAGEHSHGDDEHITLEAFHNYLATMRDFLQKTISQSI